MYLCHINPRSNLIDLWLVSINKEKKFKNKTESSILEKLDATLDDFKKYEVYMESKLNEENDNKCLRRLSRPASKTKKGTNGKHNKNK